MKAGQNCGDLVHPVPYSPELHFPEFNSSVADMKNSVAVSEELLHITWNFLCGKKNKNILDKKNKIYVYIFIVDL